MSVKDSSGITKFGRTYLWLVISVGLFVIGRSLFHQYNAPIGAEWLWLAALTVLSGSASVHLSRSNVSISISEAFVFTAVLLYGTDAGTITVALDGLVLSFWVARQRPEFEKALFNVAAPAFSAWSSAQLFFFISGIAPLSERAATINQVLPGLALFALVYFILNCSLIAFAIAFKKHMSPVAVWRGGFMWLSLNYFCGASVAMLLVGYTRTIDLRFIALVIPVLLVLYFTFKFSMEQIRDAEQHVKELNRLYLCTIETLAMAIDAKDQVTHGHIRRVQALAVHLARDLGVRDETQLKALEAAALLHDMGKIAVPEHILNKPGRLTPAEFEKMKLHASVGADILASIDFPYPIVPIVRHHHENWDGTGYPAGLKGVEIPFGARVLAVVDCFDALTSDRPYRTGLAAEEAFKILRERRGIMYDPILVDRFLQISTTTALVPTKATLSDRTIAEIAASRPYAFSRQGELPTSLPSFTKLDEALSTLANTSFALIRTELSIIYGYDKVKDEIVALHAIGAAAARVLGTRIMLGKRVSGWVAANQKAVVNSDPALDLVDIEDLTTAHLRSCLSVPVCIHGRLVGAISTYSCNSEGFGKEDLQQLEAISNQLAPALEYAAAVVGCPPRPTPISA
jgi:putative nucleotidyltransferase with HDIG domain